MTAYLGNTEKHNLVHLFIAIGQVIIIIIVVTDASQKSSPLSVVTKKLNKK